MTFLHYWQAVVLGLIQGLTEFLPISSSGHLVIVQNLFSLQSESPTMLLFDIVTHVATVIAVMIVFARDFQSFLTRLCREATPSFTGKRYALRIAILGAIACIATAVIGLGFKKTFESAFASAVSAGAGLLVTGCLLFAVGRAPRGRIGWRRFGWFKALAVGFAQGIAIWPGVSRSGSTICVAMMLGLKRRWAAQFSFLIAVPAILGAAVLQLRDAWDLPAEQANAIPWGPILVGALVALVSGVMALRMLLAVVIANKLSGFRWYCWTLGALVLGWSLIASISA